jgi:hypothetical protein
VGEWRAVSVTAVTRHKTRVGCLATSAFWLVAFSPIRGHFQVSFPVYRWPAVKGGKIWAIFRQLKLLCVVGNLAALAQRTETAVPQILARPIGCQGIAAAPEETAKVDKAGGQKCWWPWPRHSHSHSHSLALPHCPAGLHSHSRRGRPPLPRCAPCAACHHSSINSSPSAAG